MTHSTDTVLTLQAALGLLDSRIAGELPGTRPDIDGQADLAGLSELCAPVAPPPDLFAAIEQEIDAAPTTGIRTIRAGEGNWRKSTDKIWKKILSHDATTGRTIALVRCEAGAVLPEHVHEHDEMVLMLEGEYRSADGIVRAGDVQISPAGSFHQASVTPMGCLLLVAR